MKVWIVTEAMSAELGIVGVYSTEEQAKKSIDTVSIPYQILEWEVDSPVSPIPVVTPPTPPAGVNKDKERFAAFLPFIYDAEGRTYEDNPKDSGGPTKFGINTTDDGHVWRAMGVTDLRDLTEAQATLIMWGNYWLANDCDELPSPVAEVFFNFALNAGRDQAIRIMQEALGVIVDGRWGPITDKAVKIRDPDTTAREMITESDKFYHKLALNDPSKYAEVLDGWLNRNNNLRKWFKFS